MKTSSITWHSPDNPPDMDITVLVAMSDGDVCAGFLSTNADDRAWWYDVTAIPLQDVAAWAEMPEFAP